MDKLMSRCEQLLEEGFKNHVYSAAALAVGKGDQKNHSC